MFLISFLCRACSADRLKEAVTANMVAPLLFIPWPTPVHVRLSTQVATRTERPDLGSAEWVMLG